MKTEANQKTANRVPLDPVVGRLVVAFGGGVNSTAMIVKMRDKGMKPDLILFADTGGERPETYETVDTVSAWCVANGFPAIVTVKAPNVSLEEDCLKRNALPSIAYGFKSCSQRWKLQPQQKYLNSWKEKGEHYTKAIGFDAGEERRVRDSDDQLCTNIYPLVEWNIWREECEAICVQEGLPSAKSSCFFCPSMRKSEVIELGKQHPDLMDRAIKMEKNAELITVQGLGRHWSWADVVRMDEDQLKLFSDAGTPEMACGCYDG